MYLLQLGLSADNCQQQGCAELSVWPGTANSVQIMYSEWLSLVSAERIAALGCWS